MMTNRCYNAPNSTIVCRSTLSAGAEGLNNKLLGAMPASTFDRIAPHLTPVRFDKGTVLYELDEPIRHVYFVNHGLVSLVKTMKDGRMVEIGAIGTDGVTGINALFDIDTALFETIMQIPGEVLKIPVADLRRAMAEDPLLHDLLEGYVHVILAQIAQTAACNRLHSTQERCCRWLLVCHDSALAEEFHLTHEFLAMMLGVRRVSVTMAASGLQKAGHIKYSRGRITVTNRAGLEAQACECYSAVKSISGRLLSGRLKV
ncbi:Crp/Fnr family transcriptional regulator [Henriciella aquimarina]|uniref:Crp/Fnr family transcriptional regulator n=1 Tax=Henriciella aquimarina TaxID=545261 RepID=UPI0009FE8E3C|nr:Crp/Fnr family transcriptional regulator [Henriciella aquimarina]